MWLMHWVSKIAEGGFPREGYPKGFNSEYLKAAVIANCAIMARELGEKINVSYMTILGKLKKNGKVSVFGKWVPHNLSLENHQQCFDYCNIKCPFWTSLLLVIRKLNVDYKNM